MIGQDFARGSQWGYWDLHLHAPGTLFNDNFNGDWEQYLTTIETSDVKVLGITDYFSLRTYKQVQEYQTNGRLKNIRSLIPNIEIRLKQQTKNKRSVNCHLLIDPDLEDIERKVERLFQSFIFNYEGDDYGGDKKGLIELGRAFKKDNKLPEEVAFKIGAEQFKIDPADIRKARKSNKWMQESCFIGVSAGNDGLAGLRQDNQFRAIHDEICRLADFIFSSIDSDIKYWGLQRPELIEEVKNLRGPKACLHGCDAHSIDKLLNPDKDRRCWIKADHTFEGLRQAILEPIDRVVIGPTNPELRTDKSQVIKNVIIDHHKDWFKTDRVVLNSGLVSIIGKKGSGKSALAEMIAVAAGHKIHPNDQKAFLNRAKPMLEDIRVTLEWEDDNKSNYQNGKSDEPIERVRFLSQSFVDELCSAEDKGARLAKQIENIVFEFVNVEKRGGATNFRELRSEQTKTITIKRESLRNSLEELNHEAQELHARREDLPEKRDKLKKLQEQLVGINTELLDAQKNENKEYFARMEQLQSQIKSVQTKISKELKHKGKIEEIATLAGSLNNRIATYRTRVTLIGEENGLNVDEFLRLFPHVDDIKVTQIFDQAITPVKTEIQNLTGDSSDLSGETLVALKNQYEKLNQEKSEDQVRRDKLHTISKNHETLIEQISKLSDDINMIENKENSRLEENRRQRIKIYKDLADLVFEEKKTLQDLYAAVQEHLGGGTENEKRLELDIKINVDHERWFTQAKEIINRNKNLNWSTQISTYSDLENFAEETILAAWETGDANQIESAISSFLSEIRKGSGVNNDFLRSSKTYQDFLSWLYDTSFVSISYSLKYDKTPIEKLSPGTRGIILLILYLGVSKGDRRPLIIDQPEENLDNDSIYADLVGYFRNAKQDRQVILVSHNPNLVVNTDSEQVIIAESVKQNDGRPEITYVGGSIEDKTLRPKSTLEQVCTVLEGGPIAFSNRNVKYRNTY